ncbi:glycosyltransferase family 2 protein [Loigolactobacillus coryniformis]|uniref:glycosyltransferase family 2 protein n=1 Tax=Loigolactobacillus coryniformis TaxID=1610 RepID=UPI00345CC10C
MPNHKLVSIVLPVYNVAPYLKKCLDSLLAQTYRNLEIIIINDGSTDESPQICEQYRQHPQVRLYHQKNQGIACARNAGLAKAKGAYIGFIDSDDWIAPDMYARLLTACQQQQADIAICGRYMVPENGPLTQQSIPVTSFNRTQAMRELLLEEKFDASACDKLFDRHLFDHVVFPAHKIHDDVGTVYRLVHQSQRTVHIGAAKYYYRQRNNSISVTPLTKPRLDLLDFSEAIVTFIERHYPNLQAESNYFYYRNVKNLMAQLATSQRVVPEIAARVRQTFNQSFFTALTTDYFTNRDRAVLIAARLGIYRHLKQLLKISSTE